MKRHLLSTMLLAGFAAFAGAALLGPATATAAGVDKVTICHRPPGNPSNVQTITIGAPALAAHLKHGDYDHACASDCRLFATNCNDGNECTYDECNVATGACVAHAAVECTGDECTDSVCDNGTCVSTPLVDQPCSDDNACTGGDLCTSQGACGGTAIAGCCNSNADCAPVGDACTTESCSGVGGTCLSTPVAVDDGDPCTIDGCSDEAGVAVVVNIPKQVDDGIACTDDSCNSNGDVVHAPVDSACGDYTSCTTDSCSAATGCVNTFTEGCKPCHGIGDCDNANACDGQEACDGGGACASGTPPIVDDGNVCTADSCNEATGPVHASLGGSPCGPSDASACDADYMVCSDTTCTAAPGPNCDDGNPNTADTCNPVDATCTHVSTEPACPCWTEAYLQSLVYAQVRGEVRSNLVFIYDGVDGNPNTNATIAGSARGDGCWDGGTLGDPANFIHLSPQEAQVCYDSLAAFAHSRGL